MTEREATALQIKSGRCIEHTSSWTWVVVCNISQLLNDVSGVVPLACCLAVLFYFDHKSSQPILPEV